MSDFKNEVLDMLGIKLSPNIKGQEKYINKYVGKKFVDNMGQFDKNNSIINQNAINSFSELINDFLINKAKSEVTKTGDPEKDKENISKKAEEFERALKSYSINDILNRTNGININSSFYKANTADFLKRASREMVSKNKKGKEEKFDPNYKGDRDETKIGMKDVPYFDKNPNLIKEKINENIYCYLAKKDFKIKDYDIQKNDIILVGTKGVKFTIEDNDHGPSQTMEYAVKRLFGGIDTHGTRDAIIDIRQSGIPVSIKCYKNGNNINLGSIDAISKFIGIWKLEVYTYKNISDIVNGKDMTVYVCSRDNEHSKLYKTVKDGNNTKTYKYDSKFGEINDQTNGKLAQKGYQIDNLISIIDNEIDKSVKGAKYKKDIKQAFRKVYNNPANQLAPLKSFVDKTQAEKTIGKIIDNLESPVYKSAGGIKKDLENIFTNMKQYIKPFENFDY